MGLAILTALASAYDRAGVFKPGEGFDMIAEARKKAEERAKENGIDVETAARELVREVSL